MSQWAPGSRSPSADAAAPPSPTTNKPPVIENDQPSRGVLKKQQSLRINTETPPAARSQHDFHAPNSPRSPSTPSRARGDSRVQARPLSMIQTYNPPQMDVATDTPPELQPIFTFLNSHSNKLYQEGYFLKLHDLDTRGRPSADRTWSECFAQLVGTVLSLWDAAALDAAGEDGEVVPTFINLSDASIKMIESLPMNGAQGGSLQNVLSVSTAANNRYLLHFNSLNSLTQWTAGIRLAMFEHAQLQEAYTGSLIAGKGRDLNNIKAIMERSRFQHEDWARVRFGAGTPWKRCWCVITPPDEKEYAKAVKEQKKAGAYEKVRYPKGEMKFYDTRKVTKKTKPIATVTDAYAAYAIYPQSKPLIDQSTLVKLEGLVTVHGQPPTTSEGFVFIMPEVHPAVSGFEMMLQFLFPVFDTFCLYGRPSRLIADTLDQRGLMFAMPRDRRYGYLDILDVSALIHTEGSQSWNERQWRREMKKLVSQRMTAEMEGGRASRQFSQRRNTMTGRTSLAPAANGIRFEDVPSTHSTPGSRSASPVQIAGAADIRYTPPRRTDSAPPAQHMSPHKRSASDALNGYKKYQSETPSRLSYQADRDDSDQPPPPPRHGRPLGPGTLERIQSGAETPTLGSIETEVQSHAAASPILLPPEPVATPPSFMHQANSRPANQPYAPAELRRQHSNVDEATLNQMRDAARPREEDDLTSGWEAEMQYRVDGQGHNLNSVASNSNYGSQGGLRADRSQGTSAILNPSTTEKLAPQPRQRLSTIPGSPHTGQDADHLQSPEATTPVAARVVADAGTKQAETGEGRHERQGPPSLLSSSHSIQRKPIPKSVSQNNVTEGGDSLPAERLQTGSPSAANEEMEPPSPDSPVAASWAGDLIDEDALAAILNSPRADTMLSQTSHASSATPDYASTAPSERDEKREPTEKPRAGVLKMVGNPEYKPEPRPGGASRLDTWAQDKARAAAGTPVIDFVPTYSYTPISRPGTSGTMTGMESRSRPRSGDHLRQSSQIGLSRVSPAGEANRHSYFGGRTTPSPGGLTPTDGWHAPGNRHSIAWQPISSPVVTPGGSKKQSLTPEQWVQYRAALASQPQAAPPRKPIPNYAHHRPASGNLIPQVHTRPMSKTPPPLTRTPSGDWSQQRQTPLGRPHSRGASATLTTIPASQLTAKEQMQVARVTNTPLVNYTTNADKKAQEPYQPGLFGAMAAREKEKADSKKVRDSSANRLSMNVQQAIAMKQQQQYEAEAAAQVAYQAQVTQHAQQQSISMMQQMQNLQLQSNMMLAQQQQQQQQQQRLQQAQDYEYPQSMYGGNQMMQSPMVQTPGGNVQSMSPTTQGHWQRQQSYGYQYQQGGGQYGQQGQWQGRR
ncbi:Pleckstrin homology domain [Teratosphaeria destructans]|uniref:Pleckstrin homology domain n=1 Tax=Teratosphaeria destructans TaxID=418781 RepID=A0A9W7SQH2_9PEZI|nr:Pleckstrin homology domain [Teratosphaeria destructans]